MKTVAIWTLAIALVLAVGLLAPWLLFQLFAIVVLILGIPLVLAKLNMIWTFLEEGYIMAILIGEEVGLGFVANIDNYSTDQRTGRMAEDIPRRDGAGKKIKDKNKEYVVDYLPLDLISYEDKEDIPKGEEDKYEEILRWTDEKLWVPKGWKDNEIQPKERKYFSRKLGLHLLGVPFYAKRFRFDLRCSKVKLDQNTSPNNNASRAGSYRIENVEYLGIDGARFRDTYALSILGPRTKGQVPVDAELELTVEFTNAYIALFTNHARYLDRSFGMVESALRGFLGNCSIKELLSLRTEIKEVIAGASEENKKNLKDLIRAIKAVNPQIIKSFGIRITIVAFRKYDYSGKFAEEMEKALIAQEKAENEGLARLATAKIEVQIAEQAAIKAVHEKDKTVTEAEATRIKKEKEGAGAAAAEQAMRLAEAAGDEAQLKAVKDNPETLAKLRMAEAAKNWKVVGNGSLVNLEIGDTPKPKPPEKKEEPK